jgi:hypothetical protein
MEIRLQLLKLLKSKTLRLTLLANKYTVCTGLLSQCKGTAIPLNSKPTSLFILMACASKQKENKNCGREFSVDGIHIKITKNLKNKH